MKSTLGDSVIFSHMPSALSLQNAKKKMVKKTPTTVFDVNKLKDTKIFVYLDVHLLKEVTLLLYKQKPTSVAYQDLVHLAYHFLVSVPGIGMIRFQGDIHLSPISMKNHREQLKFKA